MGSVENLLEKVQTELLEANNANAKLRERIKCHEDSSNEISQLKISLAAKNEELQTKNKFVQDMSKLEKLFQSTQNALQEKTKEVDELKKVSDRKQEKESDGFVVVEKEVDGMSAFFENKGSYELIIFIFPKILS